MTIQHYQDRAMSTCMDTCMNPVYMLMNLGAEVGELQSKIAKAVRSGVADINENRLVFREQIGMEFIHPFMESLAYEIGDILWQTAGIAKALGFSLDEIAMMNLNKLASRKERGVIDGNGDNR